MLRKDGDKILYINLSVFKEVDKWYCIRTQFNNIFIYGDSENQFFLRYSSYNINGLLKLVLKWDVKWVYDTR